MITIKQGESYRIPFTLKQDGQIMTPDMIQDLKVCIGDYHFKYSDGTLRFEEQSMEWWFRPTQGETLAMPEGRTKMCAHIKYHNGDILIEDAGAVIIKQGCCGEEF